MTRSVCCKVGSLVEKYNLNATGSGTEFDEQLISRWLGRGTYSSVGYRPLTEWFNKRLLKTAYEQAGRNTMSVRVDSDFESLTGDDIVKMELLDELDAAGIDGQELLDDMISWSTMRNHLKDCLEADKATQPAKTNWERESIDIAMERSKKKAREALKSFKSKGKIEDQQDIDIEIKLQLCCSECPTRVPLDVALNRNYVCAEHRSGSVEEAEKALEIGTGSGKSLHWSPVVHQTQEPSFGV
ncbi:rod-determining factor RdfA [Haloarchaeobius sp. TZWSO28]|uniref:rod-determining factor RdfA n=1 Tax=Haloarchaeobius sp. TZWSO28 TaxID=3446119 RepID=UPI003EB75A94